MEGKTPTVTLLHDICVLKMKLNNIYTVFVLLWLFDILSLLWLQIISTTELLLILVSEDATGNC